MKILAKKLNIVFFFTFAVFAIVLFGFAAQSHAYDDYSGFDSGYGAYYDNYDSTCYDCNGYSYDSGYYDYNNYSDTCYDCGYSTPYYYSAYSSHDTCGNGCNNNYVPPVMVSCTPNTYNAQTGQNVVWSAAVSGGSGNYSYSWSGTDGLSGGGNSQSRSYSSSGTKNAHVTVTSGGKSASADCSTYVSESQNTLSGSCSVDRTNVNRGDSVNWSANASGGNGSYSYSWSGDYPLSGQSGSNVTASYDSTGSKYGTVTITSGNQTITRSCGSTYVNDNYQNFNVSCSIDNHYVNVGDQVHMNASASGGNGNYYYTWYGSSPLDGRTGSSQYVTYDSTGDKSVSVTVNSNGQQRTQSCGTVHVGNNYNSGYNYNYYNNDLNISCTVNSATAAVGQNVIWNTSVTGGNGSYYYSWTGTDGLYGNSSTISRSYPTAGIKSSTVTVTSNGQTKSLTCPTVNVGGGTVALYQGPNQGNLASLSSVYLNQVPYTGVGDNPKLMMFIVGLLLWSGAMAYAIIRRQTKSARKNAILDFKRENMAKRGLM